MRIIASFIMAHKEQQTSEARMEVFEGEQFVLAGFVHVYPSTPEGGAELDHLLKQAKR